MLVGPCGATGPDGQPDAGCSCWRGPLWAEVTVPGDVLGWTPGGVHRRDSVGIGKPGAGALGSLLVGFSPLAITRNEQVDQSTGGGPCPLGFPTKSLW